MVVVVVVFVTRRTIIAVVVHSTAKHPGHPYSITRTA